MKPLARVGASLLGLGPKLVGANTLITLLTCLVLAMLASSQVERNQIAAYAARGEAIALSLAAAAEQAVSGNSSTLQGAIDSNKVIAGVLYVYLQDTDGSVLAHTFSPSFPAGLEKTNTIAPGDGSLPRVRTNPTVDLATPSGRIHAIDVGAPISGGALGVVHVGMDRSLIEAQVRSLQERMLRWGLVVALLGIALSTLVTAFTVLRPVRELTRVTDHIVQSSDLTVEVPAGARDELGQLARSFAQMVRKLREALNELRLANETLDRQLRELERTASEQTQSATRQAAALQETQVTAQEIKQTSALAAQKAEQVLKDAERADRVSREGEEAIGRSLSGLAGVRAQVADIATRVQGLASRAVQIGGITQTVKDLADQSNMLALNAAIEAVRSGEHGRGFAVVAREIRTLADQSIDATRRVREVLNAIGGEIRGVVQITEAGVQRIEVQLEELRSSGQNLGELSGIVKDNSASARQIAAAVSQQNAGIVQIFAAVSDLSAMMKQTMAGIDATSGAANQLAHVSKKAAEVVRTYRV